MEWREPHYPLAWVVEPGAKPWLIAGTGNRGAEVERDGGGPGNRSGGCGRRLGVGGVSPTKGDLVTRQRDEAMVGNGDAMGIGAQVVEDILGAPEGRLAV